jgi:exocyst complex component 2
MPGKPPPVVTGISPKEGKPGTKVVIRGEHFGSRPADLIGNA